MLRLLVFIICFTVVSYGLFRSQIIPSPFRGAENVMHFVAFLGISFSARLAFPKLHPVLLWGAFFFFSVFSEWLQSVVTERGFSPMDIVSNLCGVLAAMLCYWIYRRWLRPLFGKD